MNKTAKPYQNNKEKKKEIIKIKNEREDITVDPIKMRITREY